MTYAETVAGGAPTCCQRCGGQTTLRIADDDRGHFVATACRLCPDVLATRESDHHPSAGEAAAALVAAALGELEIPLWARVAIARLGLDGRPPRCRGEAALELQIAHRVIARVEWAVQEALPAGLPWRLTALCAAYPAAAAEAARVAGGRRLAIVPADWPLVRHPALAIRMLARRYPGPAADLGRPLRLAPARNGSSGPAARLPSASEREMGEW